MIFSNDVFLRAIQTRTKGMLNNIDAYKSRIEQCNADLIRITDFSVSMFGEPPSLLRSDKDSIHFFIKLIKMKLLNELVTANIKFSSSLQDFVERNTNELRTLFNYLELLTFNDDLSDNAEKSRLIFDLKYDLRSMDVELENFERYFIKLRETLVQTHQKVTEFVNCYFSKQRRERITLLDLRDGKIKTIKKQLAQLKKSDVNREFQEQIQELEDELLRKCNEIVEKTEMIELILSDENESLYYGFHLLNDLSAALDEIQVKSLNLKTTIEIVEINDPVEKSKDLESDTTENSHPADRRSCGGGGSNGTSNQPERTRTQPDLGRSDNLLGYDQTGNHHGANIWSNSPTSHLSSSPPESSCVLFDGSLKSALSGGLNTTDTLDQLCHDFDIDRPSSSLGSSTDISFINEQLNGSISGGSSPSESLCSSFGRSLKLPNASGRSSVPVCPPSQPVQPLNKSVNSYHKPPQQYNPPQLYNPPNKMPNGMPVRHGSLAMPVFGATNGPLSQSTNSHLAGKLSQPFNQSLKQFSQSFTNQFPINDQSRISYAKSLTIRPAKPKQPQHAQQHHLHPKQHQQQHPQQCRQQQPLRNQSNRPLNGKVLVSNSAINSTVSSASDSIAGSASSAIPVECSTDQQKENIADPSAEAPAKSKTKCCRKQRMANRDKKLSTLSCEHKQAGSANVEPLSLSNVHPQPAKLDRPTSNLKFAGMFDSTSATSLAA